MIFDGELRGKDSLEKRKTHAHLIYLVGTTRHPQYQPITFTTTNGEGVSYLYDDPMAVVANIDGFIIKIIMVDSRNSYTILT